MELSAFKEKLKTGNLRGWYIFSGEEDYLKKHYLAWLRSAVLTDETFALFNHTVYDGQDINFQDVSEAIKSPPMMCDYKLIEWQFANLESLKDGEKQALLNLFSLKEDYPCAIFVIMTTKEGLDVSNPNRPSKLVSSLSSGFDIITFSKSTDSQLASWMKRHFDAEGLAIDMQTAQAMLFRVGHSMDTLALEIDKLSAFAKARGEKTITREMVDEVTSSTIECDAFALSNAITEKNVEKAFLALSDLKARRVEPFTVIAMLERSYAELLSVSLLLSEGKEAKDIEGILKMHPFKTKLAINAAKKLGKSRISSALNGIRRIDSEAKSGGSGGYRAIEIFITQNI